MEYVNSTIKELVENNFVYQLLSDKLDIPSNDNYKTFKQVCVEKEMNYAFIEKLIKAYDETYQFPYAELRDCSVLELVDYLQKSHTYYIEKKLPEIEQTAIQVFQKYNDSHKLLAYLCLFFNDYKKKIIEHIQFEEKKLFPHIKNLIQVDNKEATQDYIFMVLNDFSVGKFLQNHTHIEDELQEVRKVIMKYSIANKLPFPYKVFLNQLYYFEIELTKHAIIEDEILIPKVIELEAHLLKKAAELSLTQ